jgi:microcompartment protein CcmL/EutN
MPREAMAEATEVADIMAVVAAVAAGIAAVAAGITVARSTIPRPSTTLPQFVTPPRPAVPLRVAARSP